MEELNANYDQKMWDVCITNTQFCLVYLLSPGNIYKDNLSGDSDER